MLLENFLLSRFAKEFKFTLDPASIRKRYHIFFLIITNLLFFVVCFLYDFTMARTYDNAKNYILSLICCVFLVPSFIFLRHGNQRAAAGLTMCCFNTLYFALSIYCKIPLNSLNGLYLFPLYGLLLGFSTESILLSSLVSVPHFICYVLRVKEIFQDTFNDEQAFQFSFALFGNVLNIVQVTFICLLKTLVEKNMWENVKSNFEKSEALTKEIVQVIEGRDAFIFSLSCEIEKSLHSLNERLSYLLQRIKDHNHLEALKNIKLNIEVLHNTITNILDVSRLKENRPQFLQSSTNFVKIIEKAFGIHAALMQKKDVFVLACIEKNLPKRLWTDSSRLLQIIVNLVSNALNHSLPHGKIHMYAIWCPEETNKALLLKPIVSTFERFLEVDNLMDDVLNDQDNTTESQGVLDEFNEFETENRLHNFEAIRGFEAKSRGVEKQPEETSRQKNWIIDESSLRALGRKSPMLISRKNSSSMNKGYLKVQITDNGQGISRKNLITLFEIFKPSKSSSKLSSAGASLGLWVCKQLCQKMNGGIQVFSTLNKGTTFVFYIPVDNNPISLTSIARRSIISHPRPRDKVTALVVDDYDFNRDLHRLLLEKLDVHVIVASDGKEALETYKKYGGVYFDFIMMDVRMPVMDGFESARKIREWEHAKNKKRVDIYFVSGEYFSEVQVISDLRGPGDMSNTGGIKCMRKPIDMGILRTFVQKYKVQA